jgi:cell division protein FtsB
MKRQRKRISYKKELYYILCIVSVLIILLCSFLGPGGFHDLQKARIQLQEQRARVDRLKQSNSELLKSIEELKYDRQALEKIARQQGYAKGNEVIQQLSPDPETSKESR